MVKKRVVIETLKTFEIEIPDEYDDDWENYFFENESELLHDQKPVEYSSKVIVP